MANALAQSLRPDDPSEIGYPPTLPIEIALKTAPLKVICEAYGLGQQDWERLRRDPVFIADLKAVVEELRKDGMSFKMKARLQAEELLKTSWRLIHSNNDDVPPNVKADLIKFTIRAAGLDGSKDQAAAAGQNNALQININL
jgi:hypothetical protein